MDGRGRTAAAVEGVGAKHFDQRAPPRRQAAPQSIWICLAAARRRAVQYARSSLPTLYKARAATR